MTNVRAQQLPDRTVEVLYDLSGVLWEDEVFLDISNNGGTTYDLIYVEDDFGLTDGTNRFVWDCSATLPANTYGTNYKARVVLVQSAFPFDEYYGYSNIFTIDLRVANPTLSVSPSSLTFSATAGTNPPAQTLSISNTGSGTLSWSVSDNANWLSAAPTSGSGNATVTVSVSTAGLPAGSYAGAITVSASGASGSPKTIPVTLLVTNSAMSISVSGPESGHALEVLSFSATAAGCTSVTSGWNWHSGYAGMFFEGYQDSSVVGLGWLAPGIHSLMVSNSGCPGAMATTSVQISGPEGQTFQLRSADGQIRADRPTIVFTHGWQLGQKSGVDGREMWSCVTDCDASVDHPVGDMLSSFSGNKLQFVWTGAGALEPAGAIPEARAAATALSRLLLDRLGTGYSKDMHFVGHSLGTIVNAEAVATFLPRVPGVRNVQFTSLDRPDGLLNFASEFFPSVLGPAMWTGRTFKLDNYWSETGWGTGGETETGSGQGGETQGIAGEQVYNHWRPRPNDQACKGCPAGYAKSLSNPGQLGNRFFPQEGDNDHSGVQQWYRWSMGPNDVFGGSCVSGSWAQPGDQTALHGSLNPCRNGWDWSLFGPNPAAFPNTPVPDTPAVIEEAVEGFDVPSRPESSSIAPGTWIPPGTRALKFKLTATSIAASDFVAVFLASALGVFPASHLIWSGQASVLTEGTAVPIGPVPIGEQTGNQILWLEVVGGGGTQVRLTDPRAIRLIPPCALPSTLCVTGSRFRVEAEWEDHDGNRGKAVPRTVSANDSGFFWFFGAANLELVVKVLNGCGVNDHHWVFAAGLTNVGVRLKVTDTWTGEVRTYTNPPGTAFQPIQDTTAFATCTASPAVVEPGTGVLRYVEQEELSASEVAPPEAAGVSGTTLLLSGDRFAVNVDWRTASGTTGVGTAVALTGDTGYFWFFGPGNIEVMVKMIDACGFAGAPRYWLFAGGLTDLELTITVRDTQSGQTRTYSNPLGTPFQSIQDTDAFATCGGSAPGSGVVTTLAGSAVPGSADGTGSAARFNRPYDVAADSGGNVYVADHHNSTIRKITSAGVVTTFAGLAGNMGTADGTGSAARFNWPEGIAADAAGNLYITDTVNSTIRKVTAAGVVTTLAGLAGSNGSADGQGSAARFHFPGGIAADVAGSLFVTDTWNHTIRKVTAAGVVTTLAGLAGSSGSADGQGSAARFNRPDGIAADAAGNLYVADKDNHTIRKLTAAGAVTTLAGLAGSNGSADGQGSAARFFNPFDIAADAAGNLYVADSENHTIRKVTAAGDVTTLAGLAGNCGIADGTGSAARFCVPVGVGSSGSNVYVADYYYNMIRVIR